MSDNSIYQYECAMTPALKVGHHLSMESEGMLTGYDDIYFVHSYMYGYGYGSL